MIRFKLNLKKKFTEYFNAIKKCTSYGLTEEEMFYCGVYTALCVIGMHHNLNGSKNNKSTQRVIDQIHQYISELNRTDKLNLSHIVKYENEKEKFTEYEEMWENIRKNLGKI